MYSSLRNLTFSQCPTTDATKFQSAGGSRGCNATVVVSLSESAGGADLGGNFESLLEKWQTYRAWTRRGQNRQQQGHKAELDINVDSDYSSGWSNNCG